MSRDFHLPIPKGFVGFRLGWLKNDIPAGLSIAAVGLPSAIAYPAIAGLPPETGIYASIAAPIFYALLGPSRLLVVGPDAATMTVLAAAISMVVAAQPGGASPERVLIASAIALIVGGFYFLARLLRLGVLSSFLSRPILVGFFAGVSVSILLGQIGRFTGVSLDAGGILHTIVELIRKSALIHWPSLLFGSAMLALLWIVQFMQFIVPGPLVVVVVAVVLSAVFDFEAAGIRVVGDIPTGLPSLSFQAVAQLHLDRLVLASAAVFLVSFGSGVVAARSFAARTKEDVDTNQELVGLGAANIGAGLLGAFPISVSDSRTAINLVVGGRSQAAGLVSALTLMAALIFFHDALRALPIPALAAILTAAAINLIDLQELRKIWRISPMEFVFALIAMWGAISFGVLNGVILAIAATLVYLLHKTMFPHDALLGVISGRDGFFDIRRHPQAHGIEGVAIYFLQGSLLFYNADFIRMRLRDIAGSLPIGTRWFIFDASAVAHIDSTGASALDAVHAHLSDQGLIFCVAHLNAESTELLRRAGVVEQVGAERFFDTVEEAVAVASSQCEGNK